MTSQSHASLSLTICAPGLTHVLSQLYFKNYALTYTHWVNTWFLIWTQLNICVLLEQSEGIMGNPAHEMSEFSSTTPPWHTPWDYTIYLGCLLSKYQYWPGCEFVCPHTLCYSIGPQPSSPCLSGFRKCTSSPPEQVFMWWRRRSHTSRDHTVQELSQLILWRHTRNYLWVGRPARFDVKFLPRHKELLMTEQEREETPSQCDACWHHL